jgi:hypothetical protein
VVGPPSHLACWAGAGRPSEHAGRELRPELLTAALELFAAEGTDVSLKAVASAAGVPWALRDHVRRPVLKQSLSSARAGPGLVRTALSHARSRLSDSLYEGVGSLEVVSLSGGSATRGGGGRSAGGRQITQAH